MRKLLKHYSLAILLCVSASANECGPVLDNLTSPMCTPVKWIFISGTLLTSALVLTKKKSSYVIRKQVLAKNHLKGWGEVGGQIGFGYLNGLYFLGSTLWGGAKGRRNGEYMLEASLYSLGVTMALKRSIDEKRPGYPDDHDSFPSGHSSFAFSFASVVTANHGWAWGGLAHLTAAYIAFSRINDDWHYLHDVVAGITIGISYGWGIYYNHKKYRKPYWFAMMTPTSDLNGGQLLLTLNY